MIIRSSWAQHQSLAQGRMSVIIAPSHPTALMQHQSLVQSRATPPHVSVASTCINILRKVEGTWSKERQHPHPTPPHPMWVQQSTSCARSRERGRRNVNIPTPPHPMWRSSNILCKVEGMWPKRTLTSPPHSIPPHPILPHVNCGANGGRCV